MPADTKPREMSDRMKRELAAAEELLDRARATADPNVYRAATWMALDCIERVIDEIPEAHRGITWRLMAHARGSFCTRPAFSAKETLRRPLALSRAPRVYGEIALIRQNVDFYFGLLDPDADGE